MVYDRQLLELGSKARKNIGIDMVTSLREADNALKSFLTASDRRVRRAPLSVKGQGKPR